jgi:hypothetical protein
LVSVWVRRRYIDDLFDHAGLEVLLGDLLDGWGEVERDLAHGGD